jgi:hypothetical protein
MAFTKILNFDTENPRTAKRRFKMRGLLNFGYALTTLIISIALLMQVMPAWMADVVATGFVMCLYFAFWNNRAIKIRCPHCKKMIRCNTPWICSQCGSKNMNVNEFPFLNRCENNVCGVEPKAYKCHHTECGRLIFLTDDEQQDIYAQSVGIKVEPQIAKKEKDEKTTLHEEIQIKKLEVHKAVLGVQLKGLNESLQPPPKKLTAFEELEAYFKGTMANDVAEKEWRAIIDATFPNDKDKRERGHAVVDQWMKNKV